MTMTCVKILRMRKSKGMRKMYALKTMAKMTSSRARRERTRKLKVTSMKMMRAKVLGKLSQEDLRDQDELIKLAEDNQEDSGQALRCLKEASGYLDDIVINPTKRGDTRYTAWADALDSFLHEMRIAVEEEAISNQLDEQMLSMLTWRLYMLKIREYLDEQAQIRMLLIDTLESLFENARERLNRSRGRRMGV